MKKLFYILASAVVALGAMACNNEFDENTATNGNGEKVSFVAEIGEATRVNIGDDKVDGKYPITLDADDTLIVQLLNGGELGGTEYTFTTTDGQNFECTEPGVSELLNQEVYVYYNHTFCSMCGIKGIDLNGSGTLSQDNKISLKVMSPVLMFESDYDVTFNSQLTDFPEVGIFSFCDDHYTDDMKAFTIPASEGVHYIAVTGGAECTFSYSIDGDKCKEITTTFEPGKIYNLGTLGKLNKEWELMGGWQGSDWTSKYLYNEGYNNIFVARNVQVKNNSAFLIRLYNSWDDKVALYENTEATVDYWYDAKKNSEDNKFSTDINISAGTYDIWFDQKTFSFMIATKDKTPIFYSVIGTINNGSWNNDIDMILENGWFVATVDAKANNEFKIRKCRSWDMTHGYGDWFEAGKELVSDNGGNFKIKAEGKYKISMKKDTSKIKIEKL